MFEYFITSSCVSSHIYKLLFGIDAAVLHPAKIKSGNGALEKQNSGSSITTFIKSSSDHHHHHQIKSINFRRMAEMRASNGAPSKIHVVFLHSSLRKRPEDRYLVDIALAMQEAGHKVSIYTSEFEQQDCYQELDILTGSLSVSYSGWWLPKKFKLLRSILMALRMIFFPPKPKPAIIVLDISTVALYLIAMLSSYKTIYLSHFAGLHQVEQYTKFMKVTPNLIGSRALKFADDILVQSEGLAGILKRSYPNVHNGVSILQPCFDTGSWSDTTVDITSIAPNVPKPNFLFVCFGCYKKRSNFELVVDAFNDLLAITSPNIRSNVHLVIAGHCNEKYLQDVIYYNELLLRTKGKSCASQVTFLMNIPIAHKKTLIEEAIGVIFPCKHEVFPGMIIPVLAAGRPIIATDTGFAREALKHRITGILVEPSPKMFAAAMYKVLTNPAIQIFLGDMGHDVFVKQYSKHAFRKKVNGIVLQCCKEETLR